VKNRRGKIFSILQKVGKSLMMPVSVLPAVGLLVALGRMLENITETASGEVTNILIHALGRIMFTGGVAVFENLPVVFAIGVAIGFSRGAGAAGLSAVIGYFTMINVINVIGEIRGVELAINVGVFGGIVIGLLAAKFYNRYFKTKLHPVLGFFSGKRIVPIITAVASIIIGIVFGYVWPPIQNAINLFGIKIMDSYLGPAFYAAGKRLLIPVGLHHVYYQPFLFQFGVFITKGGKVLYGESARYFAGDPTAGRFMASEFPIMLFGLPAAVAAMYLRVDKNRRKAVVGIMITAALTSIITGITEPIEFTFIFTAPILYIFHVLAAFVSGFLTAYFDVHLGYTFSASLIDFFVGFYNQKNSLYLFIIGPIIAALYFLVFYWLIGLLNIKTPGREDEKVGYEKDEFFDMVSSEKAVQVLKAIGYAANVESVDSCITRLRLTVYDSNKVDKNRLRELGAAGILDAGSGNFQVIFGTEADMLSEEINKIISKGGINVEKSIDETEKNEKEIIFNEAENAKAIIKAAVSGELIKLEDVPDYTFAKRLLGDGIAINPCEGIIYSPVDGKIAQLFSTNHAVAIVTDDGVEVLIHIGIDTVKMNGKGFKAFAVQGDIVKTGDKLIEFDIELIRKEAKSIITPIVITNSSSFKGIQLLRKGKVKANEELMKIKF
jgi:glucose-specific phosphotransferase system IIA component